jgi:hypothetical protein
MRVTRRQFIGMSVAGTAAIIAPTQMACSPARDELAASHQANPVELSIDCYLIDTGANRILVDTGAGELFGGRRHRSSHPHSRRPSGGLSFPGLGHVRPEQSGFSCVPAPYTSQP